MSSPLVSKVTFEHHHDGFGLGYSRPRLSWRFTTSENPLSGWKQTAYEVEVEWLSPKRPTETFSVESDESTLVPWPAEPLSSRGRAAVRVRVRGRGNEEYGASQETSSEWSPPSIVEAGLLERDDWAASFIAADSEPSSSVGDDDELAPHPLRFRKEFKIDASVFSSGSRACLYITGLGVLKAYINGHRTSDEEMAPGWTSYHHRLNYRVHDVTDLLKARETNVIVVEVAQGWYAGRLGFDGGTRFNYGKDLGVLAQLEISNDGEEPQPWRLCTDTTWAVKRSPIRSSSIYDGEGDASLEWTQPVQENNGQSGWESTRELPWPGGELVAPDAAPVRVVQTIDAVSIFQSTSGKTIVDFGQNLVGKVQVQEIDIPKDREVTLKHAEVMEDGELGTRPLRLAKATDTVMSAGKPLHQWSPEFTFHGFRYVQVDGLTDSDSPLPAKENFKALVMHTDLKPRGEFTCSEETVNQLYRNIRWSMKGNFLSIPTDCPQRDERLGWTGDIQIFCPTANFLYDSTGMLKDWLQDLKAEQMEYDDFIPPFIVPSIPTPGWPHMPAAVWDDVLILTPYALYESSGDRAILERHFESMRGWLDRGIRRDTTDGLWDQGHWQLGDWLDPKAPADDPAGGVTDDVLVADAYLVHITTVFADACKVLGKTEEHAKYAQQAAQLKEAFQHKYITPAGNLMSNTQTGIAIAVRFGLYRDARDLETARSRLEKLVRRAGFNIATGFVGTPAILGALTSVGRSQLAYRMLLEKTCPSWLYPVTMGATTVWERWDSMLPDGSINPGSMTSFNHYALGAVAEWLHATVGGISAAPNSGWRRILVRPVPGGSITSAAVSFDGPYGLVRCEWRLEGVKFTVKLVVPPNSSAEVTLPSEQSQQGAGDGTSCRVVGSGTHHFTCDFDPGEWPPKPIIAPHREAPTKDVA
ncbi:glycoside hydrolase family 78 protein [Apiospora rasikravindrae]|uniref:alpha-L-rhamnosidase n=1 Tax=Apiospora rasikravindrae TaxID=990691 RepID=A0ABR1SCV6_9PEZI